MNFETVTIPRVEICRAGVWNSRNGKAEITREDLAAAVEAYTDPDIDRGRLKLGHVSSLNNDLGDGAPAYGWVENPVLSEDGTRLYADLAHMPKTLAALVKAKAYPQRSIEMRRNVRTPGGKLYRAAISGLALLGASAPAVKGMEDIAALYASENTDGPFDDEATEDSIVTVTLSGEMEIPENATRTEIHPLSGDLTDSGIEAPDTSEGTTNPKETPSMAFLDEARKTLGLPTEATEEQILAAMSKTPAPEAEKVEEEAPAKEAETPEVEAEKVETPAETAPAEKVEASADVPETIELSAAVFQDMKSQLDVLLSEKTEREHKETIESALKAGKITPSERDQWEVALSASPDTIRTMLDKLPARVNVNESGNDVAMSAVEVDKDALDATLTALGL